MTNVSTPEKKLLRRSLFTFGERALSNEGWKVSRIPRAGKASLRLIERGGNKYKVAIRTSQDTWIAFQRNDEDNGWGTLDDVDFVVAVSVNEKHGPTSARVHRIPAQDARDRFDRAYAAKKAAGYTLPVNRGIWLSLYDKEANEPVSYVGAGMGIAYPSIATEPLATILKEGLTDEEVGTEDDASEAPENEAPLTISEAKRRLALTLGVPETAIKITVEH